MKRWTEISTEPLTLARTNRLADMYVLSPFVWRDQDQFRILCRAVPRRDDDPRLKMAEIWHGTSADGKHFDMDVAPTIFPGPELADLDGCEDPTVRADDGQLRIWYTGYNQRQQTGRLLLARGPEVRMLAKAGICIDSAPPFANPKESTVARLPSGRWRMFFEYADGGCSRIGVAEADGPDGPWRDLKSAPIEARSDQWDCWHLSPGPIVGEGTSRPVMFYNGADEHTRWRIGWIAFDRALSKIVARSDDPLIIPVAPTGSATDMAFAASAVEDGSGRVLLYYSISDQDLRCATLEAA